MNEHTASAPDADEAFARSLGARLHAVTDGIEPQITFDEMMSGTFGAAMPRRAWARAGAIGLAAASLVAVLAWTVRSPGEISVSSPSTPRAAAGPSTSPGSISEGAVLSTEATATTSSLPAASAAVNILVVGVDNNACVDPNSPYAGGFGDRTDMGERSDTIMIVRIDPAAGRAAVLSFPRDLWVTVAGRDGKNRINSSWVRNNPTRLLATIYDSFGVEVDHFVQIDFCAFKTIVDGLGGVTVPFEHPARDVATGLNVPEAGCFTLDGDHALAYVRSRKYEYLDDSGTWQNDGWSDLGRISRQQDFMIRTLSTALDRGITDASVARSLIAAAQDNVVVDDNLTLNAMLEYVGVLASMSADDISSYQIEAIGANVGGNAVLLPQLESENMRAVLDLFGSQSYPAGGTAEPTASAEGSPLVAPQENPKGIVPPSDVAC